MGRQKPKRGDTMSPGKSSITSTHLLAVLVLVAAAGIAYLLPLSDSPSPPPPRKSKLKAPSPDDIELSAGYLELQATLREHNLMTLPSGLNQLVR